MQHCKMVRAMSQFETYIEEPLVTPQLNTYAYYSPSRTRPVDNQLPRLATLALPTRVGSFRSVCYSSDMTTQAPLETDPARDAKKARIAESIARSNTELASAEAALDKARARRKSLMGLALDTRNKGRNLFTYDEVAAMTGLSRSAVFKAHKPALDAAKDSPA